MIRVSWFPLSAFLFASLYIHVGKLEKSSPRKDDTTTTLEEAIPSCDPFTGAWDLLAVAVAALAVNSAHARSCAEQQGRGAENRPAHAPTSPMPYLTNTNGTLGVYQGVAPRNLQVPGRG